MKLLFILLLAVSGPLSAGKIYQCSDKWGKPIFSDKPCTGSKGVEKTFQAKSAQKAGTSHNAEDDKTFDEIRRRRKIDSLKSGVKRFQRDIAGFRRSMAREVAELENQQLYAANNLAGANYHSSLSTKIQAVTQKYNSLIDGRNESIKYKRSEIERLSKMEGLSLD